MSPRLFLLVGLLVAPVAMAQQQQPLLDGPAAPALTREELVRDLASSSTPDQLFAARELRRQLRSALRARRHAPAGSLRALESREVLTDLGDSLPGPAMKCLASLRVRGVCADMLRLLAYQPAMPALYAATLVPGRGSRKVQRAHDAVEATL